MLINSVSKVDKLTKRVENVFDQRETDDLKRERDSAILKTINEAPDFTKMDFWCKRHRKDLTAMAYKVVFKSFGELKAYYEAFTSGFPKEMTGCCNQLRRNITNKNWDNYYRDSEMIQSQAKEAFANGDLLQPGQDGFNTKYGDFNKKKWAKMEAEEKADFKKKIMLQK